MRFRESRFADPGKSPVLRGQQQSSFILTEKQIGNQRTGSDPRFDLKES
jgi:hypothetical protein